MVCEAKVRFWSRAVFFFAFVALLISNPKNCGFRSKPASSKFYMPYLKYTTDNVAMIGAAGYFQALCKDYTDWEKLKVDCNLEL